jgi:hypothetical protein
MKNILYFFITLILFSAYQSNAKILRLGFTGKAVVNVDYDYTNVQDLINAAMAGDTIQVYNTLAFSGSGKTGGALSLSLSPIIEVDKPLVFIGYGFDLNDNTGYQYVNKSAEKYLPFYFTSGSAGSVVSGVYGQFEIAESNISILNCQVKYLEIATGSASFLDNITIKGCNFADPRFPAETGGIRISVPFSFGSLWADISNLKILNNYIGYIQFDQHAFYEDPFDPLLSFSQNGYGIIANNIFANQTSNPNQFYVDVIGSFEIKNNIILDPTYDGVCFFSSQLDPFYNQLGTLADVHNNLFVGLTQGPCSDYTTANLDNLLGTNVLRNFNPNFIAKDSNLLLSTGSLAINAGKNNANANTNCGVFGGEVGDAYRFSGIPNVPAIYLLNTATNQPVGTSAIFTVSTRSNNSSSINKLEYYIDTDPGFALATNIPVTAATNISNATFTVALSALAPGMHNLVIRSRDALGNWSLNNIYPFVKAYNTVPAPALSRINKLEYFVNTDPGIGNATNVTITNDTTKNNQAIAVNMTGLPSGNHKIFVRSRDSLGRWSLSSFKTVNYTATAATKPNLGPDQTVTKCLDQTFNLTTLANVAGVTNQYFNSTFVSITNQTAVQNGVYQIIGTATSGGLKDTVQVTVNNLPKPNLGANQTILNCSGLAYNLALLFTAPGITYSYFNNTFATVANPNGLNNGVYNVIGTNANGCKDTVQVTINIGTKPNLGFDQNWLICPGTTYNLTTPFTTAGLTYQYFNNTFITITTPTAVGVGTYNVVATTASGCKDTVVYIIGQFGGVTIGADQTFFKAPTATYNLTTVYSGFNITYYNANFTQIITTPSAVGTGMYQLIASNGNCADTAKITILNNNVKPNLGPNQTVSKCVEQTVNLIPLVNVSGVTYQYFSATYVPITNQTAVQNGIYQTIATATNGGLKDTVQITVINYPKPNLGLDTIVRVCAGFTYNLTTLFTNPLLTYTYLNNSNVVITTQATAPVGIYKVIATNTNGCKDTVTVTVSTNPKPDLGLDVNATICPGTTTNIAIQVSAPSGTTLSYFNSTYTSLTNTNVGIGTYRIIATNTIFGCKDTLNYIVVNSSGLNLGPDQTVGGSCANTATTFNLTSLATVVGVIYNYFTPAFTSVTTPSAVANGNYIITGSTSSGCKDTFLVTVNNFTKPNLGVDQSVAICANTTFNLASAVTISGLTYTYFTSAYATTSTNVFSGNYYIVGTNATGCKDTVQYSILSFLSLGADQTITKAPMAASNLTALFVGNGYTMQYYNANYTVVVPNPSAVDTGMYQAIGTNLSNCKDTVKITITNTSTVVKPNLGADQTVSKCVEQTVNLVPLVNVGGVTYQYFNATFAPITNQTAVQNGMYQIIGTATVGGLKDTVKITVNNYAKPALQDSFILNSCTSILTSTNFNVLFNAFYGTTALNYLYFTLPTYAIFNPATGFPAGSYGVIATNANGCSDSAIFTYNFVPKPNLGADQSITKAVSATVNLTTLYTGFTFTYFTNTFVPLNIPSAVDTGMYQIIATNIAGCKDTIKVTVINTVAAIKPNLGPNQTIIKCPDFKRDLTVLITAPGVTLTYFSNTYLALLNPNAVNNGIYQIIGTANVGGLKDTVQINVNNIAKVNLGPDKTVKVCNNLGFNLTSLFTDPLITNYYFNSSWTQLTSTIVNTYGTKIYNVIGSRSGQFCDDTVQVTVDSDYFIFVDSSVLVTKCIDATYDLQNYFAGTGGFFTYFNNSFLALSNPSAVPNGIYNVIGANSANPNSCKDTLKITVNNLNQPNLGPDLVKAYLGSSGYNLANAINAPSATLQFYKSNWQQLTSTNVLIGNYYIVGTQGGCTDTVQVTVKLGKGRSDIASSVEIEPNSNVIIYPNPVVNKINIDIMAEKIEKVSISILDLQGKLLRNEPVQLLKGKNTLTLDIESLATGIYMLGIKNADGSTNIFKIDKL